MLLISFELSMPRNNAWNGRWTGEGKVYAVVRSFEELPQAEGKPIAGRHFTYSFGDGWVAAIDVRQVTPAQSDKLREQSVGFCGYEWMIESILRHGKIVA
jgi:hypothetical protein